MRRVDLYAAPPGVLDRRGGVDELARNLAPFRRIGDRARCDGPQRALDRPRHQAFADGGAPRDRPDGGHPRRPR